MGWKFVVVAFALALAVEHTQLSTTQTARDDLAAQVRQLQGDKDTLVRGEQVLRDQLNAVDVSEAALRSQLLTANIAAIAPTFSMWNRSVTILPGHSQSIGMPDTFTAHVRFTADGAVRARIMDLGQFGRLTNGLAPVASSLPVSGSLPSFTVDSTFHDAEGCGGYVLVIDNLESRSVILTPDVTITRAPSPVLTGACAN